MIDLPTLLHQCAPNVAPSTMQAIIRTESGFNPLAMNVNGGVRLQRKPKNMTEAAAWASWLIKQGYSVDMGLMQINSRNLARLNLTPAEVFEPCRNLRAGAAILTAQYGKASQTHGTGTKALLQAISAYNTGNFQGGFSNGYVAKVVRASNTRTSPTLDLARMMTQPIRRSGQVESPPSTQPHTADSAIQGFGSTQNTAAMRAG
ncbi:lytic transglycosylase domain-containing protein [Chitinivorax sp. B]|uniref:lytic transglycosylase domain-containing protein n=1 Tax=Chitinivorax sp. B TaxID=2502235 RepID=UPI0010F68A2B|nr:lytic transglycosylase domain-containing protein [Chitinivorax sp. B]